MNWALIRPELDELKVVLHAPSMPNDATLVITWSCNPHAKTSIPGEPSKSGVTQR
jgi:hypothetical protein